MESYTKINTDDYYRMRRRIDWIESNHLIIVRDIDEPWEWRLGSKDLRSAFITQHEGARKLIDKMKQMEATLEKAEKIAAEKSMENRELIEAHTMALDIFHSIEKRKEWWKRGWLTISRAEVWIKKFRHLARTVDPT